MIIDRGHRVWFAVTLLLFLISSALYWWYARSQPGGPSGGSWPGMAFGVAGSALMLFAGLLSARKKVPRWRLGSARMWVKGHIWLGLFSVPLILFHAGFRLGGLLEQALLAVLAIVIVSGIAGLALQQYLPRAMKNELPAETMYNQAAHVCRRLQASGDELIRSACGSLVAAGDDRQGGDDTAARETQVLERFYLDSVRPFLSDERAADSPLMNAVRADAMFAQVRGALTPDLQQYVDQIGELCDERRQLAEQVRMRGWLHGWLMIHLSLSVTLLVLGVIHVVMSLYY